MQQKKKIGSSLLIIFFQVEHFWQNAKNICQSFRKRSGKRLDWTSFSDHYWPHWLFRSFSTHDLQIIEPRLHSATFPASVVQRKKKSVRCQLIFWSLERKQKFFCFLSNFFSQVFSRNATKETNGIVGIAVSRNSAPFVFLRFEAIKGNFVSRESGAEKFDWNYNPSKALFGPFFERQYTVMGGLLLGLKVTTKWSYQGNRDSFFKFHPVHKLLAIHVHNANSESALRVTTLIFM